MIQITIKNSDGTEARTRKVAANPSYIASFELSLMLRNYDLQPGDTITVVEAASDTPVPAATPVNPDTAITSPADLPLGPAKDAQ